MMKRVLFVVASVILAGCFLEQHKPSPPVQSATGAVEGIIAIQDFKGVDPGGVFMGLFAYKGAAASRLDRISARPEQSQCRLQRKSLAAAAGFISVGTLSFGPALQNTHLEVEQTASHQYQRALAPDFPAGVYQVAAAGVPGVPGFQALLQMPEALQDVTVNGQAFGSSSVLVRKSDTLVASWRQPSVPNADHIVVLDIETKSASEKVTLHCVGDESSFQGSGGSYQWSIPAQTLAEVPAMRGAMVYFLRAIVVNDKPSAYLNVQLQGVRSWSTEAEVGD